MTNRHTPDDEETSVYTVAQLPPQAMRPVAPTSPAGPPAMPSVSQPMAPISMPQYPPPAAMAPPTVVPPLYPAYRPAGYETSGRAALAAIVLIIFGLVEAIGATFGAIFASVLRRVFDQLLRDQNVRIEAASLTGLLTAIFLTMLLLGVLQIVAAGGVLGHRRWGRSLGILLSLAGTIAGAWLVYRVVVGDDARLATLTLPLLVLVPYLLSLLGLLFPGNHFRRGWRAG